MRLRLRDIDNRDEDQRPHEADVDTEQAVGYLDGPLRRDTHPDVWPRIDRAIEALRAGRLDEALFDLKRLGIRLERLPEQHHGPEEIAEVVAAVRHRERERIDAERAIYDQLIGPGLSASDPAVQDYDLTDHLELFMADESIVKITVEVTLP